MHLLEIKNLNKYFNKTHILKNINLSIDKNEIFCLVGPSGTGKSTLGRCMLKLLDYEGYIYFQGQDIKTIKNYPRYVSFIPQEPMSSINPYFKTLDAILEPMRIMSLAFNEKNIEEVISQTRLKKELMDKKIKHLSGGERQRVAIARAIITNPHLIVADEPMSSLDAVHRDVIGRVFLDIKQKSSIFVITHDVKFAQKFCDKIGIMYEGEMVEMGLKEDIFKSPKHIFTKRLLDRSLDCQFSHG